MPRFLNESNASQPRSSLFSVYLSRGTLSQKREEKGTVRVPTFSVVYLSRGTESPNQKSWVGETGTSCWGTTANIGWRNRDPGSSLVCRLPEASKITAISRRGRTFMPTWGRSTWSQTLKRNSKKSADNTGYTRQYGCGSRLNRRGKPPVLAFVSAYQGKPSWNSGFLSHSHMSNSNPFVCYTRGCCCYTRSHHTRCQTE